MGSKFMVLFTGDFMPIKNKLLFFKKVHKPLKKYNYPTSLKIGLLEIKMLILTHGLKK